MDSASSHFTSNDENFLEAFAIFCGMGISNVRMYETACVAMAKQQVVEMCEDNSESNLMSQKVQLKEVLWQYYWQVTLEVLSYHAIAPLDEAIKLSRFVWKQFYRTFILMFPDKKCRALPRCSSIHSNSMTSAYKTPTCWRWAANWKNFSWKET